MHHNTKFGNKMLGALEDIIWKNINILTLRYDLDPECSNPTFFTGHSGLWWRIIRPSLVAKESTFWLYEPSLWPWPWRLQQQQQNFPHDTLAHNAASPYQIWQQNVQWFRKKSPGKTFIDILNLLCDLEIERSNPIFQQDTLALDAVLSNQFGCKPTSTLKDTAEIIIWALAVTLTMNTVNQFSAWHSDL